MDFRVCYSTHFWLKIIFCFTRFTGTTKKCLNLGSYNYLGFAQEKGPCADASGEKIKELGCATGSPRIEFGKWRQIYKWHGSLWQKNYRHSIDPQRTGISHCSVLGNWRCYNFWNGFCHKRLESTQHPQQRLPCCQWWEKPCVSHPWTAALRCNNPSFQAQQ